MGRHSYADIAADWVLWIEHVDPHPAITRDEFDAMSLREKICIQEARFGPDAERVLPAGLCEGCLGKATTGPRDQRIRDLERILGLLEGWETEAARALRWEVEDALAELMVRS
jgi:hypothetical protein